MLVQIILLSVFCLHSSVVLCAYHFSKNHSSLSRNETSTTSGYSTLVSVNNPTRNLTKNNVTITSTTGPKNSTEYLPWRNQETTTSPWLMPKKAVASIPNKTIKNTTIGMRTCPYDRDDETTLIPLYGFKRLTKESKSKIKCLTKPYGVSRIPVGIFDDFLSLRFVNISGSYSLDTDFPFGGKARNILNIETLILDRSFKTVSLPFDSKRLAPKPFNNRTLKWGTPFPHLINLIVSSNNLRQIVLRNQLDENESSSCNGRPSLYSIDQFGRYCNQSLPKLMPNLSYLDLYNNSIESLEFLKPLPDTLTHLILTKNNITEFIDISLKNIEELFIDDNNIQNLCPSRYISDNYYRCAERGLKLEDAKKLKKLSLSNTQLEFIHKKAMANLTNLVKLDLSRNELSSLDKSVFDYLEKLEILELQSNKLSNLPNFHNLKNLVKLNLSSNYLESIEDQFNCRNSRLEILSLRNNLIQYIRPGTFDCLLNLRELDLSSNHFEITEDQFNYNNSRLEILSLRNNSINNIRPGAFNHLLNLKELDLSSNRFESIEDQFNYNNSRLEILFLSNNLIHYVRPGAFGTLLNLRKLDFSSNRFEIIEDQFNYNNSRLEILSLKNNSIKIIRPGAFNHLLNLRELDLSSNHIESIEDQFKSRNLQLEKLFLSNNLIKIVRPGAFESLAHLTELDLSSNYISVLSKDWIAPTHKLKILNLNGNKFLHIANVSIELGENMKQFYWWNNPFVNFNEEYAATLSKDSGIIIGKKL